MGAVMHTVGVDGLAPNQLQNEKSLPTLRFAAEELDITSVPAQVLQHLNLQLSDGTENVQVTIAFDADHPVAPGQFVPMDEAQEAPSVTVEGTASNTERYTYVLVDIDAPDPKAPTHAPFLHYILAGLTVDEQNVQGQSQEIVIVPYYPVTPPVGEHRYVSLLFHQQGNAPDAPDAGLTAKRSNFNVGEFAKKHKLDLVATSSFHSHPAAQDN
ncbi:PEBP-like protein [Phytophthora palmivora]|uniref:PEBP-like protein n=1 Tax=Phytophthora palmivora TaxID=4796 RepID=A0A2P4Y524_9STRA|nr:PEBP-like protein [Phytophthora palmivora]